MTPFDLLGALLDLVFEWNPIVGYLVALAIAAVCTFALAYLNQDGSTVGHLTVSGRVT